jgi:glyoxylase-like metal-dependent hydrolase (beta-lactamase superfamily II)
MTVGQEYVHSRPLGEVRVTAITEGTMPWRPELTVPEEVWRTGIEVDAEGKVRIDTHVLVVQIGDAVVLIDAGLDDPGSTWEEGWLRDWPGSIRSPGVTAGLKAIGLVPEDVTHVLLTHAHFDHYVGLTVERDGRLVPRYPRARVFLGRADWDGELDRVDPEPDRRLRIGVIEQHGLLELVDSEREIVPGVTMIPAPGESPGHCVVRVTSGGETLYVVGDLFHHASEVEHLDWIVPWADEAQMRASRQSVIEAAMGDEAVVVFTHAAFPPWGTIESAGEGYRWQPQSG